jgi:rhamnose utilization protein RhaD (predicted bifunctional aldolase and dehydrogenase)/NAD(P)-dependent dehydrogenase (short-subunit alcohol dehydrogenase family)
MKSRYDRSEAARYVARLGPRWGEDLALRVYTSRLLGSDAALVLHGGGNTSVKTEAREISGEPARVLYVKGSGWDLGSIEPEGFPACRLEPLERLCALEALSDEDMVRALRSEMLDPASPTPSVEALLHAHLPARYVDHTHADAVLALVDQPDSLERARDAWGEGLLFVPYVMPGFLLARRVFELKHELARARVMVLDKHGIFTWGQSAEESYEAMIEAVSVAERAIARVTKPVTAVSTSVTPDERRRRQRRLAPLVRGALGRAADGQRFLLEWHDEPEILSLLARSDAREQTRIGTATPDHVIRTKPVPLWLGELEGGALDVERAAPLVERALEDYAGWYAAYFERSAAARRRELTRLDRLPRLVCVPGLGVLCAGKTLRDARIAGDIYVHTVRVIADALALGCYRPVGELDLFDVEYWSLEQAKLKVGPASGGPLARRVALVTGAASGIGRATAEHFLALGAHVMLSDVDAERLAETREALAKHHGLAVASVAADVTRDEDMARLVDETLGAFGGLDLVLSNAGTAPSGLLHRPEGEAALRGSLEMNLLSHQRVARAATEVLLTQNLGGCLLFNASKSAFNQGPEFGPYAIPKAAVVALMKQYAVDLGAHGVRCNAVNADRIRTALFGGGVLEARAKARGVSPDEYFRQNLLHRETTAEDVARAFGFLATAEATTGCVVTVDGGNAAAFPR